MNISLRGRFGNFKNREVICGGFVDGVELFKHVKLARETLLRVRMCGNMITNERKLKILKGKSGQKISSVNDITRSIDQMIFKCSCFQFFR